MSSHLNVAMAELTKARSDLVLRSTVLQTEIEQIESQLEAVDSAIAKLEDIGIVGQTLAEHSDQHEARVLAIAKPAPPIRRAKRRLPLADKPKRRSPAPPDYVEVADLMAQLQRDRKPIGPGVAAHYEVKLTTAKNWMQKARKLNLVPDPIPAPAVAVVAEIHPDEAIKQGALGLVSDEELAGQYLTFVRQAKRPIDSLAMYYDADRQAVQERIEACRAANLLPPRHDPQLPNAERAAALATVPSAKQSPRGTAP